MPVVPYDALCTVSLDIFKATGIPEDDARILADHVTTSNLLGHDSHGVWFMPRYVPALRANYRKWEDHEVTKDAPSFVQIDGKGANGIVAVTRAVDLAMEKASNTAFGMVGLKNVSHIGRLGDFPPRMAEKGMIGMVWMNGGGEFLSPFGSADRRLRPEPIAFAVPRKNGPAFMLDMTLSVVAGGKIEQKILRDEPIPDGWLVDQDGKYVNDGKRYHAEPENVGVLPLGGMQFGHKGHGLAMMIEMIVGPLALAGCTGGKGGGGIMILAIDVAQFMDLEEYKEEVETHADYVRSARTVPGFSKIYAPGDIEEERRTERLRDGILIPDPTWEEILETAQELGVTVPEIG
ncbi:MAG: Ldh family oxidoreductase [Candidatus Latescibacteria bacterium]|jgi:hydroxycarboxylate dehydrogenase B|nr:Ldh family oxidoreductase [Candidatus Latescibacterota bacterium]